MPSTTPRLAIPYPLSSESPNGPAQMQAIATALDNAAIDLTEGTLAARPVPSIRGRWYYATDVGILYRDSGSTWRSLQAMLGTDVITAANIAADAIGTSELAPLAVTNAEVAAAAAIAYTKLALGNSIVNADIAAAAAIAESKLALASDAAAGTASRRTLGSGATQAAPGNDARLSDQRVPTDGSVSVAKTGTGDSGLARGSFHAWRNAAFTTTTPGGIALPFDSEVFDVSNWFDVATGRFTPQVAGYYSFAARVLSVDGGNVNGNIFFLELWKNGAVIASGQRDSGVAGQDATQCATIYIPVAVANGSTDFFEISLRYGGGTQRQINVGFSTTCYFMGNLVGRS